jgi:hypothetical protein
MSIGKLKNIGPKSEAWLTEIGINTVEKLKCTPIDKIFFALKAKGFPVNMTFVYSIDGALRDEPLVAISDERKNDLKELISNSEFMGPEDSMKSLRSLTNIGKQMSIYLYESGIRNPAHFRSMGFEKLWDLLVNTVPKVGTHPAYKMAIKGAFEDKAWNDVDLTTKT